MSIVLKTKKFEMDDVNTRDVSYCFSIAYLCSAILYMLQLAGKSLLFAVHIILPFFDNSILLVVLMCAPTGQEKFISFNFTKEWKNLTK